MLEKKGIYEVLKIVAEENGISLIHAEEADIIERNISDAIESGKTLPKNHAESRPVISEIEAMYGILAMSAETKAPVIFAHMTTGASRALLERRDGAKLFAEACPHYWFWMKGFMNRKTGITISAARLFGLHQTERNFGN